MSKQPTIPDAVRQAELKLAELQGKYVELHHAAESAKEAVQQAHVALRGERIKADQHLPTCRIVKVKRYSGNVVDDEPAVIVRKTPSGILVVRRPGDSVEIRFKRKSPGAAHRIMESKEAYHLEWLELRGVPPEFE